MKTRNNYLIDKFLNNRNSLESYEINNSTNKTQLYEPGTGPGPEIPDSTVDNSDVSPVPQVVDSSIETVEDIGDYVEEADPEVEEEVVPTAEAEQDVDAEPEAVAVAVAEAEPEAVAVAEAEPEAVAEAEAKPEVEEEVVPAAEAEQEAEAEAEAEAEEEAEAEAEVEADDGEGDEPVAEDTGKDGETIEEKIKEEIKKEIKKVEEEIKKEIKDSKSSSMRNNDPLLQPVLEFDGNVEEFITEFPCEVYSNDCEDCNCCDCNKYSELVNNYQQNLNYNMGRNKTYLACIYPMQRSATVLPVVDTLNNLNPNTIPPNGCNTNSGNPCNGGSCNTCTNYNFPGSSADYCSQQTGCPRLGIRMYRGVVPRKYNCHNFNPVVPQLREGSMNRLTPGCLKQCCCTDDKKLCGQCCGGDCDNNNGCGCN